MTTKPTAHDLTTGPITATMLRFAGPMILGNLLQQCYNLADTFIVGRFLGADALAAAGYVVFATTLPTADLFGCTVQNIGNNRPERLGDFIELLENALGMRAEKRFLPMQAGDVYATEADVSDLERDFGWRPTVTAAEGIGRFAAWFAKYRRSAGER